MATQELGLESGLAARTAAVLHGVRAPVDIVFTRGERHRLWDTEGREYLDLVSGTMGTAMIGHCHPAVRQAVHEQMGRLTSNLYFADNDRMVEFAEKMKEIAPPSLTKTMLVPGGGEGIEAAIKLAMRATGKNEVLSLGGAYHGMSIATMGLSGMSGLRSWVGGAMRWNGFRQVASPREFQYEHGMSDPEAVVAATRALEAALDGGYQQVAAFVLEIVQGPNGHVMYPTGYYAEVQRICRERDVLVIVDEIQTGLGRCGTMWASDLVGLEPDILVVGKAVGGGLPFGGIVVREDLLPADSEASGWHFLTFMNQPLQAAAGLAVIGVIEEEGLVDRAAELGRMARARLESCASRYPSLARVLGPGLFLAVEFTDDGDGSAAAAAGHEAYRYGLESGVLTYTGGKGNVLKFKPPLIVTDAELNEMLERFEQLIAVADAQIAAAA